MGSVAYKLARVAAGLEDITFTLTPKHEWDVAGGAALIASAGGCVRTLADTDLVCNQKNALISGLIACGPGLKDELMEFLKPYCQR
jgi:myo-inositol-1(or 4)-monophosphatase